MKNIYMLDLRHRINQNLNKTMGFFGAMKSGFYCVIEYGFGSGRYLDTGAAVANFDFNGNKVSPF